MPYHWFFAAPPAAVPGRGVLVELESGDYLLLSGDDGRLLWKQAYGYAFPGTPTISADGNFALIKGGMYGSLITIDLATGNSTWIERSFNILVPAVRGTAVLVPVNTVEYYNVTGGVQALDLATGSKLFKAGIPASAHPTTPALMSSQTMYVATDEPALYAFSLSTGQKLWDWPLAHATANQAESSAGLSPDETVLYHLGPAGISATLLPPVDPAHRLV
jgi:outer membrane protein assembly factor BamB